MKKNNALVLSLVAVVILLVAVIGVTYAYFTSQVNVTNNDKDTTTVKTAALASATMDMGSEVTATDIYPGAKIVKPVTVTGVCENSAATCKPIATEISVTANIPTEFGSDVTWALYESTDPITCTNEVKSSTGEPTTTGTTTTTINQYHMETTCKKGTANEDFSSMQPVITGGASATKEISVAGGTTRHFYLVVSYANQDTAQNTQQGKSLSIKLGFAAKKLGTTTN